MNQFKKLIAVFGLLVFLLPTAIQLHHSFENHEHTVCISKDQTHTHEVKDIDCKICDFTFSSFLIPDFFSVLTFENIHTNFHPEYYSFLKPFKNLYISLRAPPILV